MEYSVNIPFPSPVHMCGWEDPSHAPAPQHCTLPTFYLHTHIPVTQACLHSHRWVGSYLYIHTSHLPGPLPTPLVPPLCACAHTILQHPTATFNLPASFVCYSFLGGSCCFLFYRPTLPPATCLPPPHGYTACNAHLLPTLLPCSSVLLCLHSVPPPPSFTTPALTATCLLYIVPPVVPLPSPYMPAPFPLPAFLPYLPLDMGLWRLEPGPTCARWCHPLDHRLDLRWVLRLPSRYLGSHPPAARLPSFNYLPPLDAHGGRPRVMHAGNNVYLLPSPFNVLCAVPAHACRAAAAAHFISSAIPPFTAALPSSLLLPSFSCLHCPFARRVPHARVYRRGLLDPF